MKKGFLGAFLLIVLVGLLPAQDTAAIAVNKNITVYQDTAVTTLEQMYKDYNANYQMRDGYRIQITYTNVRDEIYKSKGRIYSEFPELPCYVEYEQPNYKLRLGDFKTRLEATYYLQQVITIYPEAFIVHDKIKADK